MEREEDMNVWFDRALRLLLMVTLAVGFMACSKKKVPPQQGMGQGGFGAGDMGGMGSGGGALGADDARWRELGLTTEAERQEFMNKAQRFENEDIYFDFDSYVLTEPAKKILDDKIQFLKRYPKVRVTVEGHCDDRGTNEYNLALGERRSNSAMQYLANSGMSTQNLNAVSYGEERPLATGQDEASWARNRRAHFVLNN
jgi:peptidoglycan-associated lipoprotein